MQSYHSDFLNTLTEPISLSNPSNH